MSYSTPERRTFYAPTAVAIGDVALHRRITKVTVVVT